MIERINRWILADDGEAIQLTNELMEFLCIHLFHDYEPAKMPYPDFKSRLESWLMNVENEEEQKNLFLLLNHIFFVGRNEFDTLFRVAFNEKVVSWVIDHAGLTICEKNFDSELESAINKTWFCPVTDSLRINAFYHVNRLSSHELRPDWRSLRELGDAKKIKKYIAENKIERLVLIEDFVGSGTQMSKAIKYVAELEMGIDILLLPLIICPKAAEKACDLQKKYKFDMMPVILMDNRVMLSDKLHQGEPELFEKIRAFNKRICTKIGMDLTGHRKNNQMGMYGFMNTGAMVVMYTNCPNNTLTIIHSSQNWSPLFPRSDRIKL